MNSIFEYVKDAHDRYRSDQIEIAKGYQLSQHQTLRTIDFYHNSQLLTGNSDSLGREKPFYNIVKFRVNIATRQTDLDTKDVKMQGADGVTSRA
jgi:hypothetical protein